MASGRCGRAVVRAGEAACARSPLRLPVLPGLLPVGRCGPPGLPGSVRGGGAGLRRDRAGVRDPLSAGRGRVAELSGTVAREGGRVAVGGDQVPGARRPVTGVTRLVPDDLDVVGPLGSKARCSAASWSAANQGSGGVVGTEAVIVASSVP